MAVTTATLSGPTSGMCEVASDVFQVTLDDVAPHGGVMFTISSTVGSDTITATPLLIAEGNNSGFFSVTPHTFGSRDIAISSAFPGLTITGSPVTYSTPANHCPDDEGAAARVQNWNTAPTCAPVFLIGVTTIATNLWAQDLYCADDTVTLAFTITE